MKVAQSVVLLYTAGHPRILLRELCGADELSLSDTSTHSALLLLDRMMDLKLSESDNAITAAQIVTSDRDRILAQIYSAVYGDKIESTIRCQLCEARFDMDFSLQGLQEYLLEQKKPDIARAEDNGTYRLDPACSFRLPTGEDEMAAGGLPPDIAGELILKRCLLEGDPVQYGEQVEQAMAAIAPVLQTDIQAGCPECGKAQTLLFDIQSFLLGRLINERNQTIREIHRLATVYHWSHTEIIWLPRSLRRTYWSLIDAEM